MRKLMIIALVAAMTLGATGAMAAVIYEAELTPEMVRPSSGASAYGQATLIVNDAGTEYHLTLNFAGLDTDQTGAALLSAGMDDPGSSLLTLPVGTPLALTQALTADIAEALESDRLAVQIYSEAWPGGAIRGNFQFVTVGVDVTTWTAVKTLFN